MSCSLEPVCKDHLQPVLCRPLLQLLRHVLYEVPPAATITRQALGGVGPGSGVREDIKVADKLDPRLHKSVWAGKNCNLRTNKKSKNLFQLKLFFAVETFSAFLFHLLPSISFFSIVGGEEQQKTKTWRMRLKNVGGKKMMDRRRRRRRCWKRRSSRSEATSMFVSASTSPRATTTTATATTMTTTTTVAPKMLLTIFLVVVHLRSHTECFPVQSDQPKEDVKVRVAN